MVPSSNWTFSLAMKVKQPLLDTSAFPGQRQMDNGRKAAAEAHSNKQNGICSPPKALQVYATYTNMLCKCTHSYFAWKRSHGVQKLY